MCYTSLWRPPVPPVSPLLFHVRRDKFDEIEEDVTRVWRGNDVAPRLFRFLPQEKREGVTLVAMFFTHAWEKAREGTTKSKKRGIKRKRAAGPH